MSILRYLNKHHGWYDGKRTPFTGAEEVAAAEIALEVVAPEAIGAGAAEAGYTGATAYEAGLAGTAGNAALYGAGEGSLYGGAYGLGEGAAYSASEQAAEEAARQAAIQNAGNSQLAVQNAGNSQVANSQLTNLQAELNAMANSPAYNNVVADAANSTVANPPIDTTAGPINPSAPSPYANFTTAGPQSWSDMPGQAEAFSPSDARGPLDAPKEIPLPSQMPTPPGGIKDYLPSQNQLMLGGGLYALNNMMNADKNKYGVPAAEKYTGPLSKLKYDPSTYNYTAPVNRQYTPNYSGYAGSRYAEGGITDIDQDYAKGGIAGLLKGRGDGMSDSIHATIADRQPARLADGEFVVPADVVSHLGNGSTDAGAKHLYKMMDKVRHARTGSKKQGKQIKAGGYLPIK